MAAQCWACKAGVSPVGVPSSALPLDPLGTCWDCHVSACNAHARRDPGAGKWLCYTCVATGLAVSAGIEDQRASDVRFEASDEFEVRFPELADAAAELRNYWRTGPGEPVLGRYLQAHPTVGLRDWALGSDALGTGEFLVADRREGRDLEVAASGVRDLLTPGLASLIEELGRG